MLFLLTHVIILGYQRNYAVRSLLKRLIYLVCVFFNVCSSAGVAKHCSLFVAAVEEQLHMSGSNLEFENMYEFI